MATSLNGRLLRVDLTSGTIATEETSDKDVGLFVGGRGLGAALLYRELKPGIDPLGPENEIVFSVGPLTATSAPGNARYCLTTKSPQTNLYLMGLSGGYFGPVLKKTGYDAVIVEGKSDKPVYLLVTDDKAELRDATALWGMTTDAVQESIKEELHDPRAGIACIGPAGENLVKYACVINERRAVGRGGGGAVMGSKNLKAVVVRGSKKMQVFDEAGFRESVRQVVADIQGNYSTREVFPRYGSTAMVKPMNELGIMPLRNWQEANWDMVGGILPTTLREKFVVKDMACAPPCAVKCAKMTLVREGEYAGAYTDGPEYETIYALGAACAIPDMGAIIDADSACDRYGVDTMSMGLSISFAMECYERGLLSKADTGGLELRFGDASLLRRLIHDTAYRRGFGDALAEGSMRMAQKIGQGSEDFAMHAKGMELGGYDPRGVKGMALVYACGPRGGCHHAGGYTTYAEALSPNVDRFATEGKAQITKFSRDWRTFHDTLVLCGFTISGVPNTHAAAMVNSATGLGIIPDVIPIIGERISNLERAFNVREGLRRSWDTLPARLLRESVPDGPTKGQTVDLEALLDDFYAACGWDLQSGVPTREKLESLGLGDIASDLWG